jgi:hypothetical protein
MAKLDIIFLLKIHALLEVVTLCFSKILNLKNIKIELDMDFMLFKHFQID